MLEQTGVLESLNLPIVEIIQHAIVYVRYNNDVKGNTQMEISNENDIKQTVLKILSNVTRGDILHSDNWKRIKSIRAEKVLDNQNKLAGKISSTPLT